MLEGHGTRVGAGAARLLSRYYAFNGDADGLCALQQLRLVETGDATLVTGVKRDIRLLERIDATTGDAITALDISLDQNRTALLRLLGCGATVRYFDHHYAGELPEHRHLEAHIEETADVCTSILVDRFLGGRYRAWAIVAAFGDSLATVASAMAASAGIGAGAIAALAKLGVGLNYNAYGDTVSDLHVDPAELAREMRPFENPLDFVAQSPVFATLAAGYDEDMRKARALAPTRQVPGATTLVLPGEPWARRAIGVLANELTRTQPGCAIAILSPRAQGGFVVSVRVPAGHAVSAVEFCREFATGGGRKLAAGIDHLHDAEVDDFVERFEARYRVQP
jgi:DHHA1 domain